MTIAGCCWTSTLSGLAITDGAVLALIDGSRVGQLGDGRCLGSPLCGITSAGRATSLTWKKRLIGSTSLLRPHLNGFRWRPSTTVASLVRHPRDWPRAIAIAGTSPRPCGLVPNVRIIIAGRPGTLTHTPGPTSPPTPR